MLDNENRRILLHVPRNFIDKICEVFAEAIMEQQWEIAREGDRELTLRTYHVVSNVANNINHMKAHDQVWLTLDVEEWENLYHVIDSWDEKITSADEKCLEMINQNVKNAKS